MFCQCRSSSTPLSADKESNSTCISRTVGAPCRVTHDPWQAMIKKKTNQHYMEIRSLTRTSNTPVTEGADATAVRVVIVVYFHTFIISKTVRWGLYSTGHCHQLPMQIILKALWFACTYGTPWGTFLLPIRKLSLQRQHRSVNCTYGFAVLKAWRLTDRLGNLAMFTSFNTSPSYVISPVGDWIHVQ